MATVDLVIDHHWNRDPAHKAFRENYSDLVRAIGSSPSEICDSLYSKKLISKEIRNNVQRPNLNNDDKARILVNAMQDRLKANPSLFSDFIEVLKSGDLATKEIIAKLEHTRGTSAVDEGIILPCMHTNVFTQYRALACIYPCTH